MQFASAHVNDIIHSGYVHTCVQPNICTKFILHAYDYNKYHIQQSIKECGLHTYGSQLKNVVYTHTAVK